MIEKSHNTPTAIVGIWGTFPSRDMDRLALERKNAVDKYVNSKSGSEFSPLIIFTPIIPAKAKMETAPNKRTNRRTIQPKRELPCAEITSNIGSVRVLHHSPITIAVYNGKMISLPKYPQFILLPPVLHTIKNVPTNNAEIHSGFIPRILISYFMIILPSKIAFGW